MRSIRIGLMGCLLIAVALAGAGSAAAATDPFLGSWTSIDNDGSNQAMTVGAPSAPGIHKISWFDDFATICGGGTATVKGLAELSGDTMAGTFKVKCANGTSAADTFVSWTHDPVTDTLTDNFGVVWSRT